MAIKALSFFTFQEILRRRTLYFIFFFLLILILFIPSLPSFNVGVRLELFLDFSLNLTSLFLAILAVALSANQIYGDVERKIIYQILSKPVKRSEVIIGKYLGVVFALLLSALISSMAIFLFSYFYFESLQVSAFKGAFLALLEASLISAFVFLASTFSTPTITVFSAIAFYFLGHARDQLIGLFSWFKFLAPILPSLESYNLSEPLAHGVKIPFSYYALTFADAFFFSVFYLLLAILIFKNREL